MSAHVRFALGVLGACFVIGVGKGVEGVVECREKRIETAQMLGECADHLMVCAEQLKECSDAKGIVWYTSSMPAPRRGAKLVYTNSENVSVHVRAGLIRILFGSQMTEIPPDLAEAFGLHLIEQAAIAREAALPAWQETQSN